MTFTTHGHHIPGTDWANPPKKDSELCGAHPSCSDCKAEVDIFVGTSHDHPGKAKRIVSDYVVQRWMRHPLEPMPKFSVYVVMFAYILGGWKALVSTTLPDGFYYEITYNANKRETYLDPYQKFDNIVIPD